MIYFYYQIYLKYFIHNALCTIFLQYSTTNKKYYIFNIISIIINKTKFFNNRTILICSFSVFTCQQ